MRAVPVPSDFLLAPAGLFVAKRDVPDEKAPQRPGENEQNAQEPALGDYKRDGHGNGVWVILDHDEELRHSDGCHQPSLLAQLFVKLGVIHKVIDLPHGHTTHVDKEDEAQQH